jgi:hypothetical protein
MVTLRWESEKALVQAFCQLPDCAVAFDLPVDSSFHLEVGGCFGIPDVLNSSDHESPEITAFEMKLKNWRRALVQAYRYRYFSSRSIVVLDDAFISPAIRSMAAFRASGIGLASFRRDGLLRIHFLPEATPPVSSKGYEAALQNMKKAEKLCIAKSPIYLLDESYGKDFANVTPVVSFLASK